MGNVTVDCAVGSVKCSYGNFVNLQCDSQVLITTAADDTFCDIFPNFRKKGMIFHENRLPADDSQEISCLICSKYQNLKVSIAANYRWRFMGYGSVLFNVTYKTNVLAQCEIMYQ